MVRCVESREGAEDLRARKGERGSLWEKIS